MTTQTHTPDPAAGTPAQPPSTALPKMANLFAVDGKTIIAALALAFGLGSTGIGYLSGGRLPEESKAQIAQIPAAAAAAAAAAASASTAAASASTASTDAKAASVAASASTEAITKLSTQVGEMSTKLATMQERAGFSDKERERLEQTVREIDTRLRTVEAKTR